MAFQDLPHPLAGSRLHLVGIKGTGMCALAELLHRCGARITGSDGTDHFYTDEILAELGIAYSEGFSADKLPPDTAMVVHSAAYDPETNPELRLALERRLPVLKYTDALGAYSRRFDSSGIAGVHGKTTTTAMTGTLLRAAGLPAQILAGSAVGDFGGRSTLYLGDRYFVAETCEYRKHFLAFKARRIVLTSVESDHQDYFPTYQSIRDAFLEFTLSLPPGGELIYCADDPGAVEIASLLGLRRRDIQFVPYGVSAEGSFRITEFRNAGDRTVMTLKGFPGELRLRIPGSHSALNAAAALALTLSILKEDQGDDGLTPAQMEAIRGALESFQGSRRRSEILGEAGGVLVMDDYGHHPTAIRKTLDGLRAFYPRRRLVVSFMSHTFTRTAALLDDFAASLSAAELLILHKIYASARESYSGGVTGRTLFDRIASLRGGTEELRYYEEPLDALEPLLGELKPGDLFLTLGAGDNCKLGAALLDRLTKAPRSDG